MQPLFERCTPFTKPQKFFTSLQGMSAGRIEHLTENRVAIHKISWERLTYGTVRVFQHDVNDNEFYIAVYPHSLISKKSGEYFEWPWSPQIFDNLPQDRASKKMRDYISPMLFEMNSRREQGILPATIATGRTEHITKVELEGDLFGPADRDEIINHMRLKFAYL